MDIRLGGEADWPAIEKFIAKQDYFQSVDCRALGGHWIIAISNDEVRATIWFFTEKPHAYVDYWAGNGKALAALCVLTEAFFIDRGIRYIRGAIARENENALCYALRGVGMLEDGLAYALVFKEIGHGTAADDNDSGDRAGRGTGSSPDGCADADTPAESGATG